MTTKYFNYTVTTDCGQFDVVACDSNAAKADVMQAAPGCKIIQLSMHGEA